MHVKLEEELHKLLASLDREISRLTDERVKLAQQLKVNGEHLNTIQSRRTRVIVLLDNKDFTTESTEDTEKPLSRPSAPSAV